MPIEGASKQVKFAIIIFFLFAGSLAGCMSATKSPAPDQASVVCPPCPPDRSLALSQENETIRKELASDREKLELLTRENSDMKLQALAYEALINDLKRRSDSQQKRLDAAIIEVVRAKAKLRSLESKAEAASTLAEAELAVKGLKRRGPSPDAATAAEIATAEQLLSMSIDEFNAQNFGGALYLANQTKGQVRTVQDRLDKPTGELAIEGEAAFAQPLTLQVLKEDCNLREGPGFEYKVIGRLSKNSLVIGFSYKESWIRVETEAGTSGWVFRTLLGAAMIKKE